MKKWMLAVLFVSGSLCGCDGNNAFESHVVMTGGCDSSQSGILVLAWTIRGATPTAASCSGIDHITLDLEGSDGCGVTIDPIPCALDHFRYDHLPLGAATVSLTGVDEHENQVVSGSVAVNLGSTVPSPTPVDLN